jgi:hypothetical protein
MTLFLDAVFEDFIVAVDLLRRRAYGDYSPDQHLQALPAYVAPKAPNGPRTIKSNKTAMQLFEGYIIATGIAAGTVTTAYSLH